jgi:hypothetical protein
MLVKFGQLEWRRHSEVAVWSEVGGIGVPSAPPWHAP